jgi:hypothetical protein
MGHKLAKSAVNCKLPLPFLNSGVFSGHLYVMNFLSFIYFMNFRK